MKKMLFLSLIILFFQATQGHASDSTTLDLDFSHSDLASRAPALSSEKRSPSSLSIEETKVIKLESLEAIDVFKALPIEGTRRAPAIISMDN